MMSTPASPAGAIVFSRLRVVAEASLDSRAAAYSSSSRSLLARISALRFTPRRKRRRSTLSTASTRRTAGIYASAPRRARTLCCCHSA